MPEGDIARRVAIRLTKALVGRPITYSALRWPTLGGISLCGRSIESIEAFGKHLLMHLDQGDTLRTHLRMDGAWYIEQAAMDGQPSPNGRARNFKARIVIANQQWVAIGWLLGMADLIRTRDLPRLLGHLGPDVMASDFNAEQAGARVLAQGNRSIGATLLDQTVVVGIGTIYMAESLFRWRVKPDRPANQVPDLPGLLAYAAKILHRSVAATTPGATGSNTAGETTMVHGRENQPCRLCQTSIRVMMVGKPPFDRPAFYCPTCQPD